METQSTETTEKPKRPPSVWMKALKEFNTSKGGSWCIPKKDSEDYLKVKKIMESYKEPLLEVKSKPVVKRTKKVKEDPTKV
jgi:hypothetical protein